MRRLGRLVVVRPQRHVRRLTLCAQVSEAEIHSPSNINSSPPPPPLSF